MFKALAKNVNAIIAIKKANVYDSVTKGQLKCPVNTPLKISSTADKALLTKEGYIYPIINTTRYMDSHKDVHIDGLWNKSAKEQNGKTFYVADHDLTIDGTIAWSDDVNITIQNIDWSSVGKDYEGYTEALIFEIEKSKVIHAKAMLLIDKKKDVQSSIRMQYINMRLALDSQDPELAAHKAVFDQYVSQIANKEIAIENGYFWAITEAKIVNEGSMLIKGSNDATSLQHHTSKEEQPEQSTDYKAEPSEDTQRAIEAKRKKKQAALKALSENIENTLKAKAI